MNYEERILKQKLDNREKLKELGILRTNSLESPKEKNSHFKRSKSKGPILRPERRSKRLQNIEPPKYNDNIIDNIDVIKQNHAKKLRIKRENFFGAVPEVAVGTVFSTRMEASHAGVHRPPVAGIHGNPLSGCYSLALSGGYEDDVDHGDSFIYTGEGGRDLKGTKTNPKNLRTAPQSKDQILERGNLALSLNIQNNLPVRVLRGYKLRSHYAPTEGYRYDGLYNVVDYYTTPGLSGFNVYKFKLVRVKDQDPAPWEE